MNTGLHSQPNLESNYIYLFRLVKLCEIFLGFFGGESASEPEESLSGLLDDVEDEEDLPCFDFFFFLRLDLCLLLFFLSTGDGDCLSFLFSFERGTDLECSRFLDFLVDVPAASSLSPFWCKEIGNVASSS